MNKICVFTLILAVTFCSCSQNNSLDTLPSVLKNDTLLNVYEFKIIDTLDNGNPSTIHFFDKSNIEDPKFEKKYYKSGSIFMEGAYVNGKRDGKWTAWYENGVTWSIGNYKEGLKNGLSETYYDNGVLKYTKNYKNDLSEGLGKFYNSDGNLVAEVMYKNDEVVWQKEYDK